MKANTHETLDSDPLACLASGLASHMHKSGKEVKSLLSALHAVLDGTTSESRQARMAIQLHLAQVTDLLLAGLPVPEVDMMLSTEEAAKIMDCSRPYVAMLIDGDQLPGAIKTAGGHRKVPKSSVEAWIAAHKVTNSADYREAARDAGMYDIPESEYVRVLAKQRKHKHA